MPDPAAGAELSLGIHHPERWARAAPEHPAVVMAKHKLKDRYWAGHTTWLL